MRAAQAQVAFVLLLLVACASTPNVESARYWTARKAFVDTQETWNDMLRQDNDRVRAGSEPLFSERDRQVALLITRTAYETFEDTEPLLGDDSHTAEVMLAISKIQTLSFQLALLYSGGSR